MMKLQRTPSLATIARKAAAGAKQSTNPQQRDALRAIAALAKLTATTK